MTAERLRAQDQPIATPHRRGILATVTQIMILLVLLAILAAVIMVLVAVSSLLSVPGQVAGGVSSQLGGVASQASRAVTSAQQALESVTDPNRPPTGLALDNEFATLHVWHVGDGLPGGTEYVLTIQAIKRREGAASPDTALYAAIHAALRQPRETRVLGQVLRSDSDPHDYVLYKDESFRIGRTLFRVNWISQEEAAIAAGTYRNPDAVRDPLKFEYD
ncbi:MAG: hypothetical protein M3069_11220 [Chloroflexota bacterium]|nr:hypothetical protein [Chloroflexota bacterium]